MLASAETEDETSIVMQVKIDPEEREKLVRKCIEKCKKIGLFKTAIEDVDFLESVIENSFSLDDMERISKISEKGYIEDDLEDKMDFYNRLPERTKQTIRMT